MAKVKVLFGQMRGKVGGMVFRHDPDGFTVASEYNPKPANPRSELQTTQRNKMSLAGQISKITPSMALAALSTNKRKARSMFVSNIIKNAVTPTVEGGVFTANEQTRTLVFSKGAAVPLVIAGAYDGTNKKLTVTITNDDAQADVVAYRVIVYITEAMEWRYCTVMDVTAANAGIPKTVDIVIPDSVAGDSSNFAKAYVVPVVAADADARVRYQQFLADEETTGATMSVSATRTIATENAFAASISVDPVALG